ncbi:hypothetical protein R5R35_001292 [Gryllus longicercus]|uniref:Uncharacterized protein n=1 Tax=Gryllus longicercus TaxID=2509291 RepID=A0AAN9VN85_9ORTH
MCLPPRAVAPLSTPTACMRCGSLTGPGELPHASRGAGRQAGRQACAAGRGRGWGRGQPAPGRGRGGGGGGSAVSTNATRTTSPAAGQPTGLPRVHKHFTPPPPPPPPSSPPRPRLPLRPRARTTRKMGAAHCK